MDLPSFNQKCYPQLDGSFRPSRSQLDDDFSKEVTRGASRALKKSLDRQQVSPPWATPVFPNATDERCLPRLSVGTVLN